MDPSLYLAAMKGDLVFLRSFQETSNLELQLSPSHDTVLHVATEFHQVEFAAAVVHDCPALLWQVNLSGDTALHIAARAKHEDLVMHFISCVRGKADEEMGESRHKELLRLVNFRKDTALHCAARSGSCESVKLLAEADPEVCSFVNNADESPLCLCVAYGRGIHQHIINSAPSSALHKGPREVEEIEILVRWRPEMIREGDDLGMTPLHYAALQGKIDAIKLFLQYDSSAIYLLTNNGESALHIAAFEGHINALEELINCRPDCYNLVDNKGRTPLHAATLGYKPAAVKFILKTPPLERLINKQDYDGNTALHLAYIHRFLFVIETIYKVITEPSLKILNNQLLAPGDVLGKPHSVNKGNYMAMHEFAKADLEKMNKEDDDTGTRKSEQMTLIRNDSGSDSTGQIALESNLVVGALVATVTFTAGLTVPGGSEDQGLAVLTNKAAFQAFTVFNTLAFCCSVFPLVHLFHYSLLLRNSGGLPLVRLAEFSTTVAILAMVLAFCSGTYVVLTKSTPLSLTPFIICCPFVVVYFGLALVLFLGRRFQPMLRRWRRQYRTE